jgi:hypothetical protein
VWSSFVLVLETMLQQTRRWHALLGVGCRDGLWLTGGLALSANPAGCGNTGAPHFMAHLRTACAFRCVTPNALQHSCT